VKAKMGSPWISSEGIADDDVAEDNDGAGK
jgi:hypothetical protein